MSLSMTENAIAKRLRRRLRREGCSLSVYFDYGRRWIIADANNHAVRGHEDIAALERAELEREAEQCSTRAQTTGG